MKYADLIQYERLVPVQQLRQADAADAAQKFVETYVISDRMAEQIVQVIVPQLRFDTAHEARGLLVVGNYGTGKSHLMAVLSAVAERASLGAALRNPVIADKVTPIAGRFRVARMELGAVTMPLREAICEELQAHLADMGVTYEFPPSNKVTNNKDALAAMMATFGEVHPDQGLLVVLDELLDYLRARKEPELILDLNFLRELGEVCATTRLRFVAGLQESLFDNPRFQFVAETLRRVRDRFDQVRITREDISFVVSERLLRKTPEQRARIRAHLQKFAPLYGQLNERLEEFVRLFPVHPAFLATFEKLYVAEKREVLRTLADAMERMLPNDVPDGAPGLLAYDAYWDTLRTNATFRANPDIRRVIDKSKVVEDRVQLAFTKAHLRPLALRIIHALSVHRLTTDNIRAPFGATAEELRDDLCLFQPNLAQPDAEFLKLTIESTLKAIVQTVNGQFLTLNTDNGQYFLDVDKDIDYQALVEQRAEGISDSRLDAFYFEVLRHAVLEQPEATHYKGLDFPIWQHEVEWRERRVTRQGYLFFGTPNERPTATPQRDFYLYIVQPFDPPKFSDAKLADEVFVRLVGVDKEFRDALRLYAGAREMAQSASSGARAQYESIAGEHRKKLLKWLGERFSTAFEVGSKGTAKKLAERMKGAPANANLRDALQVAASNCLAPWFDERAPEYPKFGALVTEATRSGAAQDAVRAIAGGPRPKLAATVLEALELLDDAGRVDARGSRYAKYVVEQLAKKGQGQVLRRDELLEANEGLEFDVRFRLEPEWLVVVLAALIHSGDLALALPGAKKLDASSLDELGKGALADLLAFKHVERPRPLPQNIIEELFKLLELAPGLAQPAAIEEGLKRLHEVRLQLADRVLKARKIVDEGLAFWGTVLLSKQEQVEKRGQLDVLKAFAEGLAPFVTVAKLKNLRLTPDDIVAARNALTHLRQVERVHAVVIELAPRAAYLAVAEGILPEDDAWRKGLPGKRAAVLALLQDPKQRETPAAAAQASQAMEGLRAAYATSYLALHGHARLGAADDEKKKRLLADARLTRLAKLSPIDLLPVADLDRLRNRLIELRPCFALVPTELESAALCPHCSFRPVEEPARLNGPNASAQLATFDEEIEGLHADWTKTLLDSLSDPLVVQSLDALPADQRKLVDRFRADKALPAKISNDFVSVLKDVLKGLEKIAIPMSKLRDALNEGGSPCEQDAIVQRFQQLLATLATGRDPRRVRWAVE
ncbi:MAG: ATP-binding protein [Deltaproteobacteria bacterium]|nr:ATP-binding protein [Deltaproteobacteria bacterium]